MSSFLGSNSAKVRNARQSFMGVKRIPGDPIEIERRRIDELSRIVTVSSECVNTCEEALEKLSSAPNDQLIQALRDFYGTDGEKFELAERSLSQVPLACIRSRSKLSSVKNLVERLNARIHGARKDLEGRDKAFWEKQHYEVKMNRLSDDERLDGDKVDRNVKKMSKAITEFAESDRTVREARALASGGGEEIDGILILYSRFFTEFTSTS